MNVRATDWTASPHADERVDRGTAEPRVAARYQCDAVSVAAGGGCEVVRSHRAAT